jgi:hypothetical protein
MIIAGSNLRVVFSIEEDITGATATIEFVNSTSSGLWNASIEDAKTGTIFYDISPAVLSVTGKWKVWATYHLAAGGTYKTPAKQFTVYTEGTVQV